MTAGEHGEWAAAGPPWWQGLFYLFELTVFHPATGALETCLATDPYSRGCVHGSLRSSAVTTRWLQPGCC